MFKRLRLLTMFLRIFNRNIILSNGCLNDKLFVIHQYKEMFNYIELDSLLSD